MMNPCPKCDGRRFSIDAAIPVRVDITVGGPDDEEEFELEDTEQCGDTEWSSTSTVTCRNSACGWVGTVTDLEPPDEMVGAATTGQDELVTSIFERDGSIWWKCECGREWDCGEYGSDHPNECDCGHRPSDAEREQLRALATDDETDDCTMKEAIQALVILGGSSKCE